jgi:hypothetical protein
MKKNVMLILTLGLFTVTSCGKYEEGPSLSLRAKKARLVGEWAIESVTFNGTDVTAFYTALLGADAKLHIEKDESYHQHGLVEDEGTWKFGDGKETIIITSSATGSEAEESEILKLKSKELWLKHVHDDETVITHYKQ